MCEPLESRHLLAADLVISELMASNNSSLLDEDRDSSDWIELHNPTDQTVDLTDWTISDDADQLDKWMERELARYSSYGHSFKVAAYRRWFQPP